jgi:hypothetical protein
MSSEDSNNKKPESMEPGPGSGRAQRLSARAPSVWGALRDALAAVFNLEVLLRNAAVSLRTLLDLLPELRASAALLRDAFHPSAEADPAESVVCAYGELRIGDLDAVLDAIEAGNANRDALATRAGSVGDELEASADLLALLDRSSAPSPTEVSLALVAREAGRMSGAWRGRERIVKFDEGSPDRPVATDPVVLGPLLSLIVGCVHEAGAKDIVVRARSIPEVGFVVEAAREADAALPALSMRVLPWVPPAEAVARRVAANIGAEVELTGGRGSITLERPAG